MAARGFLLRAGGPFLFNGRLPRAITDDHGQARQIIISQIYVPKFLPWRGLRAGEFSLISEWRDAISRRTFSRRDFRYRQ